MANDGGGGGNGGGAPRRPDPDPAATGLGAPGFGWGTDPKTGAYRYGQLGAGGFLVSGTGEIPPTDPSAAHTTGNIPVSKGGGSSLGIGAIIAGVGVIFMLVVGGFIAVTISRVTHSIGTVFGGTCVGTPQIGTNGIDIGNGRIRIPCTGGGSIIIGGNGGGTVVVKPKPSPHHHHHNNGG